MPPATSLASLCGPLKFDPGEGWTYGVGIDWAGLMVEAVSGHSLEDYFAAEIFTPLGIAEMGFAVPQARRAQLFSRTVDGFETTIAAVDDRSQWEYFSGGGGLFGTAGDYLRLLQALLTADRRILGDEMRRLLFAPQSGSHRAGALTSAIPAVNAPFDLFPDMATAWSLGGLINPQAIPGGRSAGSMGWAGIANTYYWVDPTAGLCAVIFAQYMPFADPAMIATLREFEAAVYAAR